MLTGRCRPRGPAFSDDCAAHRAQLSCAAMKLFRALIVALALTAAPAPLLAQQIPPDREDIVPVSQQDPKMNAAIAEAQRTLPRFLAVVDNPPAGVSEIVFKYPLGGWEHIWVSKVEHKGDRLVGVLDNEPAQDEYRMGQRVEVPLAQVSDWGYRDASGVMQGQFTTRVILDMLPPDQADRVRDYMGWKE
ncbi:MAG TPA: DUF2314 domain-containing protein [Novosphingobium sp.]|nr:DUF2314 domain-containing protein [Novosphingobium sp.]HQA17363.1 DUF2314 domain-containing protein [Novosphingobium sp.]